MSFRDNRTSPSLRSPDSELWSLGSPLSLREKKKSPKVPAASQTSGSFSLRWEVPAWLCSMSWGGETCLPAASPSWGKQVWAGSLLGRLLWVGGPIPGWEEGSVISLPGPVCLGVYVCMRVCWHSAKGTETHPPHMPTTHTPKAIVSNHNLSLQAYGQMHPGEDVKVQIDFLKSKKGHGLWVQTDLSSNPSSAIY